jgi:adenosylcobinamide-phosphate synthase
MAVIAGGTGVIFEKLGVYRIGRAEYSLEEKGNEIVESLRYSIAIFSAFLIGALFLFYNMPNI